MGIIITDSESRQIRKLYLVEQEKSRDFDKAMKSENKKKIFSTLESIGSGDIFNLNLAQTQASKDAFGALLILFDNYFKVVSKIAKAVLLSRDGYFNKNNLEGVLFTPQGKLTLKTTTSNIDYLDDSMGRWDWWGKGRKMDKKLKNIRTQVENATSFLNTILKYIDWGKAFNDTGEEKTQGEEKWTSIDDFLIKKRRDKILDKAIADAS